MTITVDTRDLDRLAADLGAAVDRVDRDTESKVLSVVGKEVQAAAVAAAPKRTGELKGSIYLRGGRGYRIVGSPTKQGFFQEVGTSVMPPQPWLFPAAERGQERIVRLLEDVSNPLP